MKPKRGILQNNKCNFESVKIIKVKKRLRNGSKCKRLSVTCDSGMDPLFYKGHYWDIW